ncbi:MAG: histone deacetylase [Acidobacteria bacterium]|nr:histone deacetylase [Acidobacteriota bacterium]
MRVFTDHRCHEHVSPRGYPEQDQRLMGILEKLSADGWELQRECPFPDAEQAVRSLHDPRYLERFERAVERGDGLLDSADNPLCPGTWSAAWGAAEATAAAADWLLDGHGRRAFAAVRPPGHHAERGTAMGFCFLGNAAVAAEHLIRSRGLSRVAIFDFDVHHGNGTQHLFEERGDVLYASTHQHPFYPGTGLREERGRGAGVGATVNVPLPAGTGDEAFRTAVEAEILPAIEAFRPDVMIASAGFDAWKEDPIGGLRLELETFRWLGERLAALASVHSQGRLLSVLEGGYDLRWLPRLVAAYLEGQQKGRN